MGTPFEKFEALFSGHRDVHGVYIPANAPKVEGTKAEGKSFTERKSVTSAHYARHLKGEAALGVVPITAQHTVNFCAIDVDVYPLNPATYLRLIHRYNLPLCPFQSKSGGLHLYLFFSAPCPAADAVEYASAFRRVLGLPEDTEVFPKQKALSEGASGNWINLPCFGESRLMWSASGGVLTQAQSIEEAWGMRRSPEEVAATIGLLPFAPAPPCLQSMYISGAAGAEGKNRNVFLFNAAVYLKARYGENFGPALEQVNRGLDAPLPEQELHNTVIKSHSRHSYTYQCGNAELKSFCCREVCKKREFGRGGKSVSEFVYEELTQVKTDPPYYLWKVNGVDLVFYSESALRDQSKFADLAMRYLHKVPNTLKAVAWADILRTAFAGLKVQDAEGEDMTEKTLLYSYVAEFVFDRASELREALTRGCVYYDKNFDRYMFKGPDLTEFLYNVKRLTVYMPREVMNIIKKEMEAKPNVIRMGPKNMRVWCMPGHVLREKFAQSVADMENAVQEAGTAFPDAYASIPANETPSTPPPETNVSDVTSSPAAQAAPASPALELVPILDPEGEHVAAVPAHDFRAALRARFEAKSEKDEDTDGLF